MITAKSIETCTSTSHISHSVTVQSRLSELYRPTENTLLHVYAEHEVNFRMEVYTCCSLTMATKAVAANKKFSFRPVARASV